MRGFGMQVLRIAKLRQQCRERETLPAGGARVRSCPERNDEAGARDFFRQLAEDARATSAKIVRRPVRKVIEVVLADIDLAAAFGDPNGAPAFEEKTSARCSQAKSRADLLAYALKEARIPRARLLTSSPRFGPLRDFTASIRSTGCQSPGR
jgi:hypothetical protein